MYYADIGGLIMSSSPDIHFGRIESTSRVRMDSDHINDIGCEISRIEMENASRFGVKIYGEIEVNRLFLNAVVLAYDGEAYVYVEAFLGKEILGKRLCHAEIHCPDDVIRLMGDVLSVMVEKNIRSAWQAKLQRTAA